jgi:hypothetical protein
MPSFEFLKLYKRNAIARPKSFTGRVWDRVCYLCGAGLLLYRPAVASCGSALQISTYAFQLAVHDQKERRYAQSDGIITDGRNMNNGARGGAIVGGTALQDDFPMVSLEF